MLSFSNGTPKELFLEVRILEEFGALGLQSGKMKITRELHQESFLRMISPLFFVDC